MSTRDVEEAVGGEVTHATVARVLKREGMAKTTRRVLRAFVENPSQSVARETNESDDARIDLLRQVDAILALDTPGDSAEKLEALAAVWRGYALAREADAAVARGRAAVAAENGASARARKVPPMVTVRPVRRKP